MEEAGDVNQIPTADNYKSNLSAKGFDNDEIVALASVETFGIVKDPKKLDSSKFPKLDNYVYKTLLTQQTPSEVANALNQDSELKEIIQKFADDQTAYKQAFGSAFTKLIHLGHDIDDLTDIDSLIDDHKFKKWIFAYY